MEDRNPIILGRIGSNPNNPTVTIYGHYDVVPATVHGWDTHPFILTGKDGYLYGRGATDDKGPIVATVFAGMLCRRKEKEEGGEEGGEEEGKREEKRGKVVLTLFLFRFQTVKEMLQSIPSSGNSGQKDLGLNIVFVYEGEEESDSEGKGISPKSLFCFVSFVPPALLFSFCFFFVSSLLLSHFFLLFSSSLLLTLFQVSRTRFYRIRDGSMALRWYLL